MSTSTAAAPPARPPRRRRNIILAAVIVVILVLAGIVVGGEFYARSKISSCISTALESELGSGVDVDLGASPILLSAFTHSVSSVSISSDDADLSGPGQPPVQGLVLDTTLHDIDLPRDGSSGSVESSEAHVQWSTSNMADSLRSLPVGGLASGVDTDPSAGTIDVKILGGIGTISLTPVAQGGVVTMKASDVTAFGIGLPTGGVQDIIDALTQGISTYPLGMTPQSVKVTGDGLEVQLAGGHAPLNQPGMPQINCSVF